jgi:hypothetical protein
MAHEAKSAARGFRGKIHLSDTEFVRAESAGRCIGVIPSTLFELGDRAGERPAARAFLSRIGREIKQRARFSHIEPGVESMTTLDLGDFRRIDS